jgi:hypothetical protein
MAAAEEQRILGAGAGAQLEILTQGAAHGGVERDLAILEALAVPDAHAAGAVAQHDIGQAQGTDLADPKPGLHQELHEGVVAPGQTVGRGAGGAQQGVDLGVGEADRLTIAHPAHRPDVTGDIPVQGAGILRPAAKSPQGIEPPVDRGRS